MNQSEIYESINELEREIALLPPGSITVKNIKGKDYYYHRITNNRSRSETYIDFDDVDKLRAQIEKRKELEKELKKRQMLLKNSEKNIKLRKTHKYLTYVRTGEELKKFADAVKKLKQREYFTDLQNYVYGEYTDKVLILYGLRRTGKTTLIRQILADMTQIQLNSAAFIQVRTTNTLSEINSDLRHLEKNGYKYVFIDEATLMADFIEGAALFSDIYASSGMKIVLSGTDSLGFAFTKQEQLYDRCIFIHTTFIPYREFENVLGFSGIDEYIRYGGTMSMGGINYNENSSFATELSTGEYIDTAIARNIQHSLKFYCDGGHFRHLYSLYEKGELTSAINRIVKDINHRFTKNVLTRDFFSNDLAISARNLLRDKNAPTDIMQNINKDILTQSVKAMLDILNREEQTVDIDEAHISQIKEYLIMLDMISEIDLLYLPDVSRYDKITVINQPGLRYAQAKALIKGLLLDEKFSTLSAISRDSILRRILSEIEGRMLEEIILLETKIRYPQKHIFKLQFAVGEFDMVVNYPDTLSCEIYEIKHSKELTANQYRHLTDPEKCAATEHRFGTITGKYVIYRGEETETEGIKYLNAEKYLTNLK